ncbi:hypothetical protein Scep_025689 [Stephania cephalantha]|uniref:Pentatricopeptide repeat-containing protein n=1 Tax=Stephania cephalantha TaxID=152367 RepID=A0AAP0EL83_9MAGN
MLSKQTKVHSNWKSHRWKTHKFFSTIPKNQQNPLPQEVLLNILITKHARKGDLTTARKVFDEMPTRTVVSYNAMISGYSKWGLLEEAMGLVSTMHRYGAELNEMTFSSVLSVCARLRCVHIGKQIQTLVLKSGSEEFELVGSSLLNFYSSCCEIWEARNVFDLLHQRNGLLWNVMLVGYVHCGLIEDGRDLFERMPVRDVYSWTALISGYSNSESGCEKAVELFHLMRVSGGAKPNEFTFDSVLRACSRCEEFYEGVIVHGLLISFGFECEPSITGALVEFYCNCDAIKDAKKVFERLAYPCLNSLNALIGGLSSKGMIEDAEIIFEEIDELNPVLCNLMIKCYAMNDKFADAKRLFGRMSRKSIVTTNTMISVYSRGGELCEAMKLFEKTKGEGNTVTWNSMISGYVHNDQTEVALKLFVTMLRVAVERNRSTFSTLFRACSCLGSLPLGKSLHAHVIKASFELNVFVGTSLVCMYSRCGSITDAHNTFLGINSPNVAAWTSLINGYAHHGLGTEAISLFQRMLVQRIKPNAATFVGLLIGCGRAGLIEEGIRIFSSVEEKYGIVPSVEHYTCVVDLLGRSGYLVEAEKFIIAMPVEADAVVWAALLSACWFWKNTEVGERVAHRMFSLNPKQVTPYVTMSNLYAGVGKWEEVVKVRKRLRSMEVKKDPGCSWIEVKSTFHVFSMEDNAHPMRKKIYATLKNLTANINPGFEFHYDDLG